MGSKPIQSIVLDASPLLNNTPTISSLLTKSEEIYTVPSIIEEIKDANARSRLDTTILPFLKVRTPKPESIKFVSDFSRKSGDFTVLSKPDIHILALAYELECEKSGGDWRLRRTPGQKGSNGSALSRSDRDVKLSKPPQEVSSSSTTGNGSSSDDALLKVKEELSEQVPKDIVKPDPISAHLVNLQIAESSPEADLTSNFPPHGAPKSGEVAVEQGQDTSESDSDGWITPSNLKKWQAKDSNASTAPLPEDQMILVATVTGDFAMQNVLLQIGLNLLSPSFQRIKNIKTYILRCHACFEKVKDMNKQFCPRCGKPTLIRVSCSTNQKGGFKIHLKKNMQWNHRGDRFSIPKPVPVAANGKVGQGKGGGKGGWGQELILAEDQKEYLRAINGRRGKKETDLMDADYLPGILTGERGRAGGRPKVGAGRNINSKRRS